MDDCRLAVRSNVHGFLAVCMCKSSRRTTANAGKHRFGKPSHQLDFAKCRYLKLVKRSHIDKSLSFQESCCAKTAVEAAPTETFLFLL